MSRHIFLTKHGEKDAEMSTYRVSMPLVGVVTLEVEAENEEIAIERFYEEFKDLDDENCYSEWDFCEKIVSGNVFHGMQNEVDVIKIND